MRDKRKRETRPVALDAGRGAGSHDAQEPFPVFKNLTLPPLVVEIAASRTA
jgi:hypothetical protein